MLWKMPPEIKIYEALGAMADGRIKISGNTAKVFSSSGKKYYTVQYDETENAIMANDNGSYWRGYLGYPSLAYLMKVGKLPLNENYSRLLQGINWKEINVAFKNDFLKTRKLIDDKLRDKGVDMEECHRYVKDVLEHIAKLRMKTLGKKVKPPKED